MIPTATQGMLTTWLLTKPWMKQRLRRLRRRLLWLHLLLDRRLLGRL